MAWEKRSGKLVQISVGGNGDVWGVNNEGNIYKYDSGYHGEWRLMQGKLTQISVGPRGEVWGVNRGHEVYKYDLDQGRWHLMGKDTKQVSVGSQYVWAVKTDNRVIRCSHRSSVWEIMDGRLKQISVGCDDDVWGINEGNTVFHYLEDRRYWDTFASQNKALYVSVADKNNICFILGGSQLSYYDGTAITNIFADSIALMQISINLSGDCWGLDVLGNVFRNNQLVRDVRNLPRLARSVPARGSVPPANVREPSIVIREQMPSTKSTPFWQSTGGFSKNITLSSVLAVIGIALLFRGKEKINYTFVFGILFSVLAVAVGVYAIAEEYKNGRDRLSKVLNKLENLVDTTDSVVVQINDELKESMLELRGQGRAIAATIKQGIREGKFTPNARATFTVYANTTIDANANILRIR